MTGRYHVNMKNDEWLNDRVKYLKGLKSKSEQQELLVLLAEKSNRTAQDDKKFNAIIRAEKASQRAAKARQDAARLINEENRATAKAERTARHMSFVILRGCLSWRVWSIPKQASQQSIKANYWGRCWVLLKFQRKTQGGWSGNWRGMLY